MAVCSFVAHGWLVSFFLCVSRSFPRPLQSITTFRSFHRFVRQANVLDLLASKGADLNARTGAGATLAHVAARDGNSGCLKVLCERGADVDVPNQLGNTPIMFAAMVGDVDVSVCVGGAAGGCLWVCVCACAGL